MSQFMDDLNAAQAEQDAAPEPAPCDWCGEPHPPTPAGLYPLLGCPPADDIDTCPDCGEAFGCLCETRYCTCPFDHAHCVAKDCVCPVCVPIDPEPTCAAGGHRPGHSAFWCAVCG